jgi:hypothetical protein
MVLGGSPEDAAQALGGVEEFHQGCQGYRPQAAQGLRGISEGEAGLSNQVPPLAVQGGAKQQVWVKA